MKRIAAIGALALVFAAGTYAATVTTELIPWSVTRTETHLYAVTTCTKGRCTTVTGAITDVDAYSGTVTDTDTLPDPVTVTVTSPDPATTAATTGTTTTEPAPPPPDPSPPPPPPGALCPSSYADGCAGAAAGIAQYPNALDGYAARPPWNVAGVDYPVGVPEGTTLIPWRSASAANATIASSGRISCNSAGATVVLDAIDFSPSAGVSPYIYDTAGCSWQISRSKFTCPGAYANIIADNLTLRYSTMDQAGCPNSPSSFITGNTFTLEYNWFRHGNQHVLETGGPGNILYRYNLIDDMVPGGAASGQHENWQQLTGTATLASDVVEFNFAYAHTAGMGNGEGFQFYCNSGPCAVTNATLAHNTIVALAGVGRSNAINGGDGSHPGNVVNGSNSENYFDHSAGNAYYAGTMCGWTASGNRNMKNGLTINPCTNAES